MPYDHLKIEVDGSITLLTINRPEVLNALSRAVIGELGDAFDALASAAPRAVILTGGGDKAFVAGADIKEFESMDSKSAHAYAKAGQALMNKIERFPAPVIAAINGYALGGGCELALACHMRVAAEDAVFGQPEVGLGIISGFGGSQRLPRLVGKGVAVELLTTGRRIKADEALRIGLVNRVVPAEELIPACRHLAGEIAKQGPLAVSATLTAVNRGMECDQEAGLDLEAQLFASTFDTRDQKEGVRAFLEKRPPEFTGN